MRSQSPWATVAPGRTFTQEQVDKMIGERLSRDRQLRVTHEPRVGYPCRK